MVLRQLILLIRRVRPQLGTKPRKLVTDTFPKWIAAGDPLTAEEAKALARLLETLSTKSVIRIHTTLTGNQKAESLANAFSKYVPFVLNAYIDAMNDPLCTMPFEVRQELQPGLFSLCDMLNEHVRDSLMVSMLDAGGKVTLKSLWKDYEKQKYVGRG
jgi:Urb2/Npa2 family